MNGAVAGRWREFHAQAGPRPARTVEEDPAAEHLPPVLKAGQAGAAGEVGAPGFVVADREERGIAGDLDVDADSRARACFATLVSASAMT